MSVLKVHYFLWFGSLSGIMPFVSVFAKEHSSATELDIGTLYCVLPFIVSILKPLFCSIADRNNSHRKVLIVSIVITILGYGLLLTNVFIKMGRNSWYWFCFLIFLANSGQGIVISLNDYLVMKEVTELNKEFGGYRVWGTIGWGTFGVIAGTLNEYITQLPYLLPGLLLFIIIEVIDMFIIIFKLKTPDINSENNSVVVEDLKPKRKPLLAIIQKWFFSTIKALIQIYRIFLNNPSLIQYIIIVLVFGILTAFHWNYYFWYLEIIRGKEPLLFGLALFVQSFLGELPIFMISDRILKRCGPSMTLNISLSAFAIRYFIYGYILKSGTAYWDILLIEIVQGFTFSLFYTAMTNLAQFYANQEKNRSLKVKSFKSEDRLKIDFSEIIIQNEVKSSQRDSYATLQGIMSGAFEGVGLGIGALVGGYVIKYMDIYYLWIIGGYLSLATIVFNLITEILKYYSNKNQKIRN